MRLKSELSSSRARGSVLLFQSVVKARGGWHWGTRFLARHGHQYGHLLQVASQVRWHGRVDDVAYERA
jgi:hypothetical protein